MKRAVLAILAAAAGVCSAQVPSVLIEACNSLADSKKRLICLQEALQPKGANNTPRPSEAAQKAPSKLSELTLDGAAQACEELLPGLKTRRSSASEEVSLSTAAELALAWPPVSGRQAAQCIVDRESRKVVSLFSGGRVIEGARLAELQRRAVREKEVSSGNFSGFIVEAKAAVTAAFKDPASAQFQSLFISGRALPVLCGEINAKNSYGGYVGFRRFYSTGQASLTEVENPRDRFVFERMWPSMCGEKVTDVP